MNVDKIAYCLPDTIKIPILKIGNESEVSEVRLRLDKPLMVVIKGRKRFVNEKGELTDLYAGGMNVNEDIIADVFARLFEYSLYSKEDMINNGYIAMRNGCRAGICGAFSEKEFNLSSVQSINIRIANQISNVELPLFYLMNNKLCSVLISGPPCSGKTTMLRELCKRFSNMTYNVCIIDEKGEIAGDLVTSQGFDLGVCADVISYRKKLDAADMAVKYMNPDIIAYDELAEDAEVVKRCNKSGVKMFATIHADSIQSTCNKLKCMDINPRDFDLIVQLDKFKFNIVDSYFTGSGVLC